jgi:penicillin-binding protein-related factor A (putative recombinase)
VGDKFVADAGADFVACLSSGEYVAIECKQTTKQRLSRAALSAVQEAHLDAVPRSFLALLIDGRRFLIPWRKVPWVTMRTKESVTAEECAAWELRGGSLQVLALRLRE